MSTNMFEIATRNKFRFPFKGVISTEDLWDLSVESLDNVFKTLNSEMKKTKEESLLSTKSKDDEVLELKIEIVKHIVAVKQALYMNFVEHWMRYSLNGLWQKMLFHLMRMI